MFARGGRAVVALLCVLVCTALTACGGDEESTDGPPRGAVARIGQTLVTQQQYDAAFAYQRFDASARVVDGPLLREEDPELLALKEPFDDCVTKALKRSPESPEQQVRVACRLLARTARTNALGQLLQRVVDASEARRLGVAVTDAEVTRAWKPWLKSVLGSSDARTQRAFTDLTGQPVAILRPMLRDQLLFRRIEQHVVQRSTRTPLSETEVRSYYDKHPEQFKIAASRDISYVRTATAERGREAREALRTGVPLATVVKRYSNDPAARRNKGRILNVTKPVKYRNLERVVFSTEPGEIGGPVKTPIGYYLVRVDAVTRAGTVPWKRAADGARKLAEAARQQAAVKSYRSGVERAWRARTVCRPGYSAPLCPGS